MFRSPDLRPPDPGRRAPFLPAALVAAVVLAATACSGSDGESADAASATPTTAAADGGAIAEVDPTSTSTAPAGNGDGAGTTTPSTDSTASEPPDDAGDCTETGSWGTEPREAGLMAAEDVYRVRPGRHDCYDRVVFDVNGVVDGPDAVGFHVAYADGGVRADGSGQPVPVAGDAALEVIVRAPALGYGTSGHQPGRLLAGLGDDLVTTDQVVGWPALREVTFAGSFEGQTTFAVGVDRELPFRVGSFEADGYTHVYVDIARPR